MCYVCAFAQFFLFVSKMLFYGYAESQLLFFLCCTTLKWSRLFCKVTKNNENIEKWKAFFALFLSICWLDMIMKWARLTYSPRYSIIYLLFLTLFLWWYSLSRRRIDCLWAKCAGGWQNRFSGSVPWLLGQRKGWRSCQRCMCSGHDRSSHRG